MEQSGTNTRQAAYVQDTYGTLAGKTIAQVRLLLPSELEDLAWGANRRDLPIAIMFTDGTLAVPACDPEMNGPGYLYVQPPEETP